MTGELFLQRMARSAWVCLVGKSTKITTCQLVDLFNAVAATDAVKIVNVQDIDSLAQHANKALRRPARSRALMLLTFSNVCYRDLILSYMTNSADPTQPPMLNIADILSSVFRNDETFVSNVERTFGQAEIVVEAARLSHAEGYTALPPTVAKLVLGASLVPPAPDTFASAKEIINRPYEFPADPEDWTLTLCEEALWRDLRNLVHRDYLETALELDLSLHPPTSAAMMHYLDWLARHRAQRLAAHQDALAELVDYVVKLKCRAPGYFGPGHLRDGFRWHGPLPENAIDRLQITRAQSGILIAELKGLLQSTPLDAARVARILEARHTAYTRTQDLNATSAPPADHTNLAAASSSTTHPTILTGRDTAASAPPHETVTGHHTRSGHLAEGDSIGASIHLDFAVVSTEAAIASTAESAPAAGPSTRGAMSTAPLGTDGHRASYPVSIRSGSVVPPLAAWGQAATMAAQGQQAVRDAHPAASHINLINVPWSNQQAPARSYGPAAPDLNPVRAGPSSAKAAPESSSAASSGTASSAPQALLEATAPAQAASKASRVTSKTSLVATTGASKASRVKKDALQPALPAPSRRTSRTASKPGEERTTANGIKPTAAAAAQKAPAILPAPEGPFTRSKKTQYSPPEVGEYYRQQAQPKKVDYSPPEVEQAYQQQRKMVADAEEAARRQAPRGLTLTPHAADTSVYPTPSAPLAARQRARSGFFRETHDWSKLA